MIWVIKIENTHVHYVLPAYLVQSCHEKAYNSNDNEAIRPFEIFEFGDILKYLCSCPKLHTLDFHACGQVRQAFHPHWAKILNLQHQK